MADNLYTKLNRPYGSYRTIYGTTSECSLLGKALVLVGAVVVSPTQGHSMCHHISTLLGITLFSRIGS